MMTSKEVAEFLTLSLRTVRGMEADGKLPPRVQVSARRFAYRREDIEAYIKNSTEFSKQLVSANPTLERA